MEAVLGEKLPPGNFEDVFRDGVILCNLINKLQPNSVKKIQTSGGSFKLMENIQRYSGGRGGCGKGGSARGGEIVRRIRIKRQTEGGWRYGQRYGPGRGDEDWAKVEGCGDRGWWGGSGQWKYKNVRWRGR